MSLVATESSYRSRRPSVPDPKFVNTFPGGASRLAALLLPHRFPICSVVAPCDPGAAPGTLSTNFGSGTLAPVSVRVFSKRDLREVVLPLDGQLDGVGTGRHERGRPIHRAERQPARSAA